MPKITRFSNQQMKLLTWWCANSPFHDYDAVICDGAVRSGKTLCMSLSFVWWASAVFQDASFAICAKTITSLRRNVLTPLVQMLEQYGFRCEEKVSKNYVDITFHQTRNRFYLFGGKDEGSAALIQGMTLSGILLDEAALMPRSFVEQALARCSVSGSRFWFNCNPEHPYHWFYQEWIQKSREKNALYLHFTMQDNPSLSRKIRERYESLYSGTFYQRFIEGKWVSASGLVYPMFCEQLHVHHEQKQYSRYYISCDYGTVNPTSMGLWGECGGVWHRMQEYYYNSRKEGSLKTDEEYYLELEKLAGGRTIQAVIVDPSAASFMECIRRHGRFSVRKACNDVLSGIRKVSDLLREERLLFHAGCRDSIREFSLYVWEERSGGDSPKKENDHAMDDIRYFVSTALKDSPDDFFMVSAVSRG